MIRQSTPDDMDEIVRLCDAQFRRTPWPTLGRHHVVQTFHVCEREGRIAACAGFRIDGHTLRVMHVWAGDGFGGRRAAVELMLDLEAWADAGEMDLAFDVTPENVGLQAAVAEHGCQSTLADGAVHYRRRAKVRSWAVRP